MSSAPQKVVNIPSARANPARLRFVTAASLFDGHDAAINIMRRILQSSGAEVIHLGHNRSVAEIVKAAVQEDAHAIALSSYQGGHVEYLKYMIDMLADKGGPSRKSAYSQVAAGSSSRPRFANSKNYGVTRIYSPEDGQKMGLQGIDQPTCSSAAEYDPAAERAGKIARRAPEGARYARRWRA